MKKGWNLYAIPALIGFGIGWMLFVILVYARPSDKVISPWFPPQTYSPLPTIPISHNGVLNMNTSPRRSLKISAFTTQKVTAFYDKGTYAWGEIAKNTFVTILEKDGEWAVVTLSGDTTHLYVPLKKLEEGNMIKADPEVETVASECTPQPLEERTIPWGAHIISLSSDMPATLLVHGMQGQAGFHTETMGAGNIQIPSGTYVLQLMNACGEILFEKGFGLNSQGVSGERVDIRLNQGVVSIDQRLISNPARAVIERGSEVDPIGPERGVPMEQERSSQDFPRNREPLPQDSRLPEEQLADFIKANPEPRWEEVEPSP